ncbi:MAG: carbon storage regulator [Methylophaga sp.]|nr:carbon storage regulator [Methylophaga sp.]|tara:strand:+ start:5936 stop:6109 length:174 start_codon:yes stop_codon:yes gene_type:complete
MLILTRRIGESLIIDEDTVVTVLGTKGNQVRIGIDAPDDVNIIREELLSREKQPEKE